MRAVGIAAALVLAACSQESAPAEPAASQSATPTPVGKYAPRDECGALPGAKEFRQQLALAVEERSAEGIGALAAEDVKLDFGDGAGRAELLTLGCAAGDGGFTLPWYFAQEIDIDTYDGMIVTGEGVPLLPAADLTQPPLEMLNWDAVELVAGFYPEQPYQQVRFGEQQGYVATNRLRSLIDYRLFAERAGNRWEITTLIAGD
jgi:hypothetical protein